MNFVLSCRKSGQQIRNKNISKLFNVWESRRVSEKQTHSKIEDKGETQRKNLRTQIKSCHPERSDGPAYFFRNSTSPRSRNRSQKSTPLRRKRDVHREMQSAIHSRERHMRAQKSPTEDGVELLVPRSCKRDLVGPQKNRAGRSPPCACKRCRRPRKSSGHQPA
jgi:hypothetical protein